MTRNWDETWERWREMTPEERAAASAEINAAVIAANTRIQVAMVDAARAITAFAEAFQCAIPDPSAVASAVLETPEAPEPES